MGLGFLPVLAAVGFRLTGRSDAARILFASGLLCEAIVGAGFCFLAISDLRADIWKAFAVALGGMSLLLAGAGQFVAARRGPHVFAVSWALAVGSVLVVIAGTNIRYEILGWLNL